jgi:hypothetical protein
MLYPERHSCLPLWDVWDPEETREDGRQVRAFDAENAGIEWAEDWDSDSDYAAVDGEVVKLVSEVGTTEVFRVSITGEQTIEYHASVVKESDNG